MLDAFNSQVPALLLSIVSALVTTATVLQIR